MDHDQRIAAFLDGAPFAVVGASHDRAKYGNKVLRAYMQNDRRVFAVNPRAELEPGAGIEGAPTVRDLAALPEAVHGISIVTPPAVTARVIDEALALGVRHLWLQPGAEHEEAIERAEAAGANVVAYGPCVLVVLGYRERTA